MNRTHIALDLMADTLGASALMLGQQISDDKLPDYEVAISTLIVAATRVAGEFEAWKLLEKSLREIHEAVQHRLANARHG